MWIVAIAWIYVVGLMALTEPNIVSGIMTFFGFCVLPLSLVFYIAGSKRRRARRAAATPVAGSGPVDNGMGYLVPFPADDSVAAPSHTIDVHHSHDCADTGSSDAGGGSDCGGTD